MLLEPGEAIVRSEYAIQIDGEGPGLFQRSTGVLYLTSRRLVFETTPSRGVLKDLVHGRATVTVLDVRLGAIRQLEVRSPRLGRPRLTLEVPMARASFDVVDPSAWQGAIQRARQELPPPGAVGAIHTIERQVVKIRCRFCGTLTNEVDGKCASCGAAL